MCFSSSFSFGASAVLGVTGIASMAYSRTLPQRVLSGIPIIFAIQQFTEGILWLALMHSEWAHWGKAATYLFLVFAQVIWPVYVPLSMLLFEREPARKRMMAALAAAGFMFSIYLSYCLFSSPVSAAIDSHHIRYELGFSLAKKWYYGLLYFIPTIIAPVISSIKRLHWIGYLFLASYILARLLFHFYVISVWCFFGAWISIIVLWIIVRLNNDRKKHAYGAISN